MGTKIEGRHTARVGVRVRRGGMRCGVELRSTCDLKLVPKLMAKKAQKKAAAPRFSSAIATAPSTMGLAKTWSRGRGGGGVQPGLDHECHAGSLLWTPSSLLKWTSWVRDPALQPR